MTKNNPFLISFDRTIYQLPDPANRVEKISDPKDKVHFIPSFGAGLQTLLCC